MLSDNGFLVYVSRPNVFSFEKNKFNLSSPFQNDKTSPSFTSKCAAVKYYQTMQNKELIRNYSMLKTYGKFILTGHSFKEVFFFEKYLNLHSFHLDLF